MTVPMRSWKKLSETNTTESTDRVTRTTVAWQLPRLELQCIPGLTRPSWCVDSCLSYMVQRLIEAAAAHQEASQAR